MEFCPYYHAGLLREDEDDSGSFEVTGYVTSVEEKKRQVKSTP